MPGEDFVLTPWDSSGKIDYDRLSKMFGVKLIRDDLRRRLAGLAGEDHYMVRRGVFFSHRDLDMILDSQESGTGFYLYTGRGPSGGTHIGHLVPWVFARWLQERFGATIYFQLTDDEKVLRQAGPLAGADHVAGPGQRAGLCRAGL